MLPVFLLAVAVTAATPAEHLLVGPALSMYGDLKYPPGFRHFDYVNADAPKGGEVKLWALGTFDTLNPFTLRGVKAAGLGAMYDTLMIGSEDEPFSRYGLVAETIETPTDRSWVAFTLRPEARFHDGTPMTADDVVFTFRTLASKGHPFYRTYYAHIASVETLGPRKVRFTFKRGENRELPLIVSEMPVLPRTYWEKRAFEQTTLEPPLGSGPYTIESFEPGRSISYRRVKAYWGATLPVNVGRSNFDVIRYDYYRDQTVALEAFKAGAYDFREESSSKAWATAYNVPAVATGALKKEQIKNEVPTGMQGFVYNTRRALFADARVRQALAYAFDFEWTNTHLFYGAYTRTASYFSNSELASRGLPSADELEVLGPLRDRVPPEVFTDEYRPPSTAAPNTIRGNLLSALKRLEAAGWAVRDGVLVDGRTGRPFEFEILLDDPTWERITLPFAKNLERLGIRARVRTVDTAQYQYRIENYDFDMIVVSLGQSLSPGNEQRAYWGSDRASTPGSRNYAGIRDPAVDRLIDLLIAAPDRRALVARTRALDRVLLWSHYVIPHWHLAAWRVAYWNKFDRPTIAPKYNLGFDTWWLRPGAAR